MTAQHFNTNRDILARVHYQKQLMTETQDFVQSVCDDLASTPAIQSSPTISSKVNMINVVVKAMHDSFKLNMNQDIDNKFQEYEELLQIQLSDKIAQRNAYEILKRQFDKDNEFIKEKLSNLEKLQFDKNSASTDREGGDLLKKLNEVQNQTDFLLQKVNEINTSTSRDYDTQTFIKDLEQKVDYLYKNANSDIIGEGRLIRKGDREHLQDAYPTL